MTVREPGGTAAGDQIRHLLQHAPQGRALVPEAELLLFAASRAQLVREIVLPALDAGRVVISDRFLDSTAVYQGVARRLPQDRVADINAFAVGGCLPDVTFLLDMDVDAAFDRLRRRSRPADRMECEPVVFYQAVREGYLKVAASEPGRFCLLDAARCEEDLARDIRKILQERFHGFFTR